MSYTNLALCYFHEHEYSVSVVGPWNFDAFVHSETTNNPPPPEIGEKYFLVCVKSVSICVFVCMYVMDQWMCALVEPELLGKFYSY
jgi:hypothetical protein